MEVFLPPGIAAPAERGAGRGKGYGPCGPGDSPEAREFSPLKLMFADSRGSGSTLSSVFGVACINRRGHALPHAMHYAFYETKNGGLSAALIYSQSVKHPTGCPPRRSRPLLRNRLHRL